MTKTQLSQLKKQILQDIEQTKKDINILDAHSKPIEVGCCLDHIARSDLQVDIETSTKRISDLEIKLNLLLTTLKKIDKDDYGKCDICGDEIDIKRLEIIPEATQCIECATL